MCVCGGGGIPGKGVLSVADLHGPMSHIITKMYLLGSSCHSNPGLIGFTTFSSEASVLMFVCGLLNTQSNVTVTAGQLIYKGQSTKL